MINNTIIKSYIMKNPLSAEIYTQRTIAKEFNIRGAFFRDQTAIIHSLPFRRLKHKTQVFFAPENDHVCTRIEHVMHVATIAATICKGLNHYGWELDTEMAFAIGLGHDLGHAPFGHDGEAILNRILGGKEAFVHEVNSYRVVEHLACKGKGMNLTYGVKDGIICHNGERFEQKLKPIDTQNDLDNIKDRSCKPSSYEGCIMRFADKIAYLGRDIEDAIKAGFFTREAIPIEIREKIGSKNGDIIDVLVNDIIDNSKDNDEICLSNEKYELFKQMRNFNYKNIYLNSKELTYKPFANKIISELFDYLMNILEKNERDYPKYKDGLTFLDREFGQYFADMHEFYINENNNKQIVTDYISGMTDSYAIECMKQITFPARVFFK